MVSEVPQAVRDLLEHAREVAVRAMWPNLTANWLHRKAERVDGALQVRIVDEPQNSLRHFSFSHAFGETIVSQSEDALAKATDAILAVIGDGLFSTSSLAVGFATVSFDDEPAGWVKEQIVQPLMWAYLTQLPTVATLDPLLVTKLWTELTEYVEYDGTPARLRLAVGGVDVPAPVAAGGFSLRALTDDEVAQVSLVASHEWMGSGPFRLRQAGAWDVRPTALFTYGYDAREDRTDGGQSSALEAQRLITALAIQGVKLWAIDARAEQRVHPHWISGVTRGPRAFTMTIQDGYLLVQDPVEVDQAAFDTAVTLAAKVPLSAWLQPNSRAAVVCHRFMQGCARSQAIDRLLDMVFALEAGLVHDKIELSHKFALFGAQFLGVDDADRLELRAQLAGLYKIRSGLAHGSGKFPNPQEIIDSADVAERIARRMLAKGLVDGFPETAALDVALLTHGS